jgi:threonine synthase
MAHLPREIYLSHLECARCKRHFAATELQTTCTCGAPLLCRYELGALARDLARDEIAKRYPDMWRYRELLPLLNVSKAVTLGEGYTPLLPLQWAAKRGFPRVHVKDEGQNPTGTFKARGAAMGVTRLRELGVSSIALSSSGNAGDAWAAYARRAAMSTTVFLPQDSPLATLTETALTGADVATFTGHNSRGSRLAHAYAEAHGAFLPNTFQEPYRLEGKKTIGLEIAEQLGWNMPDVVLFPTGGGIGVVGIWKAFNELIELGWLTGKLPRFIITQYAGCAPIVEAFRSQRETCAPWTTIETLPGGLRSPKPIADFLLLKILRDTGGDAIAVSSDAALDAVREVMHSDGLFICPEAGTAIVALSELMRAKSVSPHDNVVVVSTGSGLKYTSLFPVELRTVPSDGVTIDC